MTIKILVVVALLLLPVHAFAAIAFDSETDQGATGSGTNSFTHTITTTPDPYLMAICFDYSGGNPAATTATYNGVAMTQVAQVFSTNPAGQDGVTMLDMMNPPTGTNTFIATRLVGSSLFYCHVISYSGAALTGQPDNFTTSTVGGSVTSFTMTLTPNSLNDWVTMGAFSEQGNIVTGTNSTLRGSVEGTVSGIWDNNAAINPIAAKSLNVTMTSGHGAEGIMISIAPFVAASSIQPTLIFASGRWW